MKLQRIVVGMIAVVAIGCVFSASAVANGMPHGDSNPAHWAGSKVTPCAGEKTSCSMTVETSNWTLSSPFGEESCQVSMEIHSDEGGLAKVDHIAFKPGEVNCVQFKPTTPTKTWEAQICKYTNAAQPEFWLHIHALFSLGNWGKLNGHIYASLKDVAGNTSDPLAVGQLFNNGPFMSEINTQGTFKVTKPAPTKEKVMVADAKTECASAFFEGA